MDSYLWKEKKWENTNKVVGSCEREICAKEEEGIYPLSREERGEVCEFIEEQLRKSTLDP